MATWSVGEMLVPQEEEEGEEEENGKSTGTLFEWRFFDSFKWYFVTKPTFITTKLKMSLYPILGSGAYGNGITLKRCELMI